MNQRAHSFEIREPQRSVLPQQTGSSRSQAHVGPITKEDSRPRSAGERAVKLVSSLLPWGIIGGLLWAGLFIKPAPVGSTVQPPVLEKRDYFYGLVKPAADQVWLAGSSGKILKLGSDGQAVRQQTFTDKTWQDIASWDAQRGVAVGNDAVIAVTTDGGATWPLADGVPRSEVANKLTRVRTAEGGVAVAVGEMGAALITRDYGESWTRLREEEDVAWNDAAILPDDRLVLVGEFGKIVVSEDGGATWSDPLEPVSTSLMAVAFRDAALGAAVGLDGVVLVTRDGGRSWDAVDLGIHDHLFDLAWDKAGGRWIGGGSLGRWVRADAEATNWEAGRLDARDLSWHTRVLPTEQGVWFVGANVGIWDAASRWRALGDAWQLSALFSLPVNPDKKNTP